MPSKIPENVEEEILALLLAGHTRQEVANKTGVSKGTVQKVSELIPTRFGKKAYEIQVLFSALRKDGIDEKDLAWVKRIHGISKRLNLSEDNTWTFLEEVASKALNKIEPDLLVKYSKKLLMLQRQYPDVPIESLVGKLEETQKRYSIVKKENDRLVQENRKLKEKNSEELQRHDVIYDNLAEYVKIRKLLREHDIDIQKRPELLVNIIKNSIEWQEDAELILQRLKRETGLKESIKEKEKEIERLNHSIGQSRGELEQISQYIDSKRDLTTKITEAERMGIDAEDLSNILESVARISSRSKSSIKETVARLRDFLIDEYSKIKSLKRHIEDLLRERERLQEKTAELDKKCQATEARYRRQLQLIKRIEDIENSLQGNPWFDIKTAVDFYESIMQSRVHPAEFLDQLQEYNNMTQLLEGTRAQTSRLISQRDQVQAELESLERELAIKREENNTLLKTRFDEMMQSFEQTFNKKMQENSEMFNASMFKFASEATKMYDEAEKRAKEYYLGACRKLQDIYDSFRRGGKC